MKTPLTNLMAVAKADQESAQADCGWSTSVYDAIEDCMEAGVSGRMICNVLNTVYYGSVKQAGCTIYWRL